MGNEQSGQSEKRSRKKERKNEEPSSFLSSPARSRSSPPKLTFDTPLHHAVTSGDKEKILSLVQNPDTDVNIRIPCQDDKNRQVSRKFFHWALDQRAYDLIDALMQRADIDINGRNGDGRTPLQVACFQNNKRLVTMILADPQVDVNLSVPYVPQYSAFALEFRSPLGMTAELGYTEIMNELLTSRADTIDVNCIESIEHSLQGKENPLMAACRAGHVECVEMLLNRPEIDINLDNTKNHPTHPLDLAFMNQHFDVAMLLLAREELTFRPLQYEGDTGPALRSCWVELRPDVLRLLLDHPNYELPSKKAVAIMIKSSPPKGGDELHRAEFISILATTFDVPPTEFISEDDPALQYIYSRKKSAYK